MFCDVIWDLVPQFIPKQRPGKDNQWMVRPPNSMRRRRKEAWNEFKQLRRVWGRRHELVQQAWDRYIGVNAAYRSYARDYQCSYEEKLVDLLKVAPKAFHSYIRKRKVGCPSVGPLKEEDGSLVTDQNRMGSLFATAFSSIYKADPPSSPSQSEQIDQHMEEFSIVYDKLLDKLMELNASSSPGPDGIHPKVLSACTQALVRPLCTIFRKSLGESTLPADRKYQGWSPYTKVAARQYLLITGQ